MGGRRRHRRRDVRLLNPAGLTRVDDAVTFMGTGGYSFDRATAGAAKSFAPLSIGVNWINAGWDGFRQADGSNVDGRV